MVFIINGPPEPSRPEPLRRQRKPGPAQGVKPTGHATDDEPLPRQHQRSDHHHRGDHPQDGRHGSHGGRGAQGDHARHDQSHVDPSHAAHYTAPYGIDRSRSGNAEQNQHWHKLYNLLFEEIDQIESLDTRQKNRIKKNLRGHLTPHAPPKWRSGMAQTAPPGIPPPHAPVLPPENTPVPEHHPAQQPESQVEQKPEFGQDAQAPLSADQIVSIAAPFPYWVDDEEARENARLAQQFNDCLAQHTGAALRVSNYLHQLMTLGGASRPHVVFDV